MNVCYLISLIIFIIVCILNKKTDEKLNLFTWIVISLIVVFCLNMFLTFVLHYMHVKSSFIVLTSVYLILSICIYYFGICNRKISGKKNIQKYNFSIVTVIYALVLIAICTIICFIRFKNFNEINYNTIDPAVHHKIAFKYSNVMDLLDSKNSKDELFENFAGSMTGSYINGGIFINIFKFFPSYISFIIYNLYTYVISALLFFATGLELCKNKHKLMVFMLACLYIFGYPLCEYLFGFYYLGIGVLIINAIILFIHFIGNKTINFDNKYAIIILFLLNYSLYFSYYLFVPFVYLSEGIFLIFKYINKEVKLKKIVIFGIISLILPFIIGTCYFILPGIINKSSSDFSSITAEGAIYRNLISNFYIFIPLIIYYFIKQIRMKKIDFETVFFVTVGLGIVVVFILGIKGRISSYYYYKFYFVLWLIVFISVIKILSFDRNSALLIKTWIVIFFITLSICIFNLEDKIINKNSLFLGEKTTSYLVDIYNYNYYYMSNNFTILNKNQINLVENSKKYFKKCQIKNNEFPIVAGYNQNFWFYSITGFVPTYMHENNPGTLYNEKFDYELWKKDDSSKCLIVFNKYNYDNFVDINKDEYKILYKNNSGVILKKIK